jgi:hypothetical protein
MNSALLVMTKFESLAHSWFRLAEEIESGLKRLERKAG